VSFLLSERAGKVAVVTLNRPERRNALGTELIDLLIGEFARLDEDDGTSVIVLAAAGAGFCAGADLKEFSGDDRQKISRLNLRMAAFARSIALMSKPVIAAVHGFAMGGGLVLAISCDVVITDAATRWRLPEVSLGWLPGFGLHMLAARTGSVKARRIAWSAEALDGSAAHASGLADILVPEGSSALDVAMAEAAKLAALPTHSVTTAKRYFAPMILGNAEPMDAAANRMYEADAAHPRAQETMQRYRKKPA
jgi:enoyl-CoA hydratase/carnithine racemase